jgi:glycosyltransferase involved in cell wall biosynthesis
MQPSLSVIIPAHNEANNLPACLQALADQARVAAAEIIVVDNASSDGTGQVVEAFARRHPDLQLRLLREPRRCRGAARATGFAAAHGDLLLSTDADTTVPPGWIANLTANLSRPGIVAVSGGCRINDCNPVTNTVFNFTQPLSARLYRLITGHWWLIGSNFGTTRAAYAAAGGFNPDRHEQEDIELAVRVAQIGHIQPLPRAAAVLTSGSRFKGNLIKGAWTYRKTYQVVAETKRQS